eukprot:3651276-Pleurochrysis_carterae.AAC.1
MANTNENGEYKWEWERGQVKSRGEQELGEAKQGRREQARVGSLKKTEGTMWRSHEVARSCC